MSEIQVFDYPYINVKGSLSVPKDLTNCQTNVAFIYSKAPYRSQKDFSSNASKPINIRWIRAGS